MRLSKDVTVSIIVCARNEKENLKILLPILLAQTIENKEIIIVNDGSTDGTDIYLNELAYLQEKLKVINIDDTDKLHPGKKSALSCGILKARHEIILLTDADCRPTSSQWASAMTRPFTDKNIDFVLGYSPYRKFPGLLNAFIQFETVLTGLHYLGAAASGVPYMGVGRNLAYRKSVFMKSKGFSSHTQLMGGDDDLFVQENAMGNNTSICWESEGKTISIPEKSIKSYFRQKKRHLEAGKNYNFFVKFFLGIISLTHIGFWVTFISLLILGHSNYLIWGGFVIRTISLIIVVKYFSFVLRERINPYLFVTLDILYIFYYIIFGSSAIFSKVNRWN